MSDAAAVSDTWTGNVSDNATSFPFITALIESGGQITFGKVDCLEKVAIVTIATDVVVALVKRDDESAFDLLQRVECALERYFRTDDGTWEFPASAVR